MTQISLAYTNWARGQIDKELSGRFDLPIYSTAARRMENFFTNFEGNAYYRTGFMDMLGEAFEDCYMWEFKFNNQQNYILLFTALELRFLTYAADGTFGFVQSGGSDLVVTTPYSLAESKELQFTQNGDVMVITHQNHPPQDLTRAAADDFTLEESTVTGSGFGAGNYPRCCQFYKGRLYFANTEQSPTTVWASGAADFDEFTVGTDDDDPFRVSIADISQPIEWLFGGENSLIAGSADAPVALNGGQVGAALTPSSVEATITSSDGSDDTIPFQKDGLVFYMGKNSRNTYYFSYDLLTETFSEEDANFISYDITRSKVKKLRPKKDKYDLIFALKENGDIASLNFKQEERIIGWHTQRSEGDVQDIVVITDNNGDPQLFALILYGTEYYIERLSDFIEFSNRGDFYGNENTERADTEAYERKIADELLDAVYLDNALIFSNLQEGNTITYTDGTGGAFSDAYSFAFDTEGLGGGDITSTDAVFAEGDVGKQIVYKTETGYESGRFEIVQFISSMEVRVIVLQTPTQDSYDNWYLTFDTLSGLDRYIGNEVALVADGGFFDTFDITQATLDIGTQVCCVVIGYQYDGVIHSFPMGFQIQAENTQSTKKLVNRVGLRFVDSAGVTFGTSRYRLEPIQELNQADLNYLPPRLMTGTEFRSYNGVYDTDKEYFIVQDKPLPCTLVAAILETQQTVRY